MPAPHGAPRAPKEPLPPMSCDCHLHVFGDPARYPDRHPNPVHKSLEATWEDALAMHRAVGFGRGVFVQPANYVSDHTYLKEALARVPRANYRATGIMDDSVSDAELLRLHEAGMRGVRFNFVRQFKMAPSAESFARSLERIRPYGWYAKLFIGADELPDYIDMFRSITTPILIDHMARTPPGHPARNVVLEMLKRENVWMLLGNGHRMSAQAQGLGRHGAVRPRAVRDGARALHLRHRLAAHPQPEGRRGAGGGRAHRASLSLSAGREGAPRGAGRQPGKAAWVCVIRR